MPKTKKPTVATIKISRMESGNYEFDISMDKDLPDSLLAGLLWQVGLTLKAGKDKTKEAHND